MCSCETCILTTFECLCNYTGLAVQLEEIKSAIVSANFDLEEAIGSDCFEQFCDDSNTDTAIQSAKDSKEFKGYYNWLIYAHWLEQFAVGKSTAEGLITKGGDDFSDFRNVPKGTLIRKEIYVKEQIQKFRKAFFDKLDDLNIDCAECDTNTCNDCSDCTTGCTCNKCVSHAYDCDNLDFAGF